jgi:coenzyme PQQ synthesis protein D (PqqD)
MTVRMKPDVTVCELEQHTVVLDERSGKYWQLNETGATMLTALLGGATDEEVAARVASVRPVDAEQALADVRALVAGLVDADLVERS